MARGSFLRPDHVERLLGMFEKHAPPVKRQEAEVCDRALCLLSLNAFGTGDADLASRVIDLNETTGDSYWTAYLFAMIARCSVWMVQSPAPSGRCRPVPFPGGSGPAGRVGWPREHTTGSRVPASFPQMLLPCRSRRACQGWPRRRVLRPLSTPCSNRREAGASTTGGDSGPYPPNAVANRPPPASSSEVRLRVIAMLDEFFEKPESEDRALRGLFS